MKVTTPNSIQKLPPAQGKAIRKLFADAAFIPGEDRADYRCLREAVFATLRAQNIVEAMLAKDVVDCEWDIHRLRRVEAALLTPRRPDPAQAAFAASLRASLTSNAPTWSPAAERAEETERLAKRFVDYESQVEQVSRMIAGLEVRRINALRELEKYRQGSSRWTRPASDDVIDADFEVTARRAA
jgi:hypothetical protein